MDSEHARLRTKARAIDIAEHHERLSLIADYVRDFEAHQQLIEEMLSRDDMRALLRTLPDDHAPQIGVEDATRDAGVVAPGDRAYLGAMLSLRRLVIDREFRTAWGHS